MSIHSDSRAAAQAAAEKVYDDEFGRLIEEANSLRQAKSDAEAREQTASLALTESENLVKARDLRIKELDAQISDLQAKLAACQAGTTPPPVTPKVNYKPITVDSLQAYLDQGYGPVQYRKATDKLPSGLPAYVSWPSDAPANWDLESQHRAMQAGQYLVLPERVSALGVPIPYPVDMTDGFAASGVLYVTDTSLPAGQQQIPISRTWKGKGARTWFAASRGRGGIIGLGPKAVVKPVGSYSRPPQGSNKTMTYTMTDGSTHTITGNQEKLIEFASDSPRPYIGNFTMEGDDFGGIAYHGIIGNAMTVENMFFDSCWRGHGYAPNSETGAFASGGASAPVRNVTIKGTNAGRTSIIMTNRVENGYLENVDIIDCNGGITRWACKGKDVWRNVRIPAGCNVNIEANEPGYELDWEGGTIGGDGYNINCRSPYDSAKITVKDVETLGKVTVFTVNVWAKALNGKPDEPTLQKPSDIKRFAKDGTSLPVKVAGWYAGRPA